jgi:hypothetical protein
LMIFVWTAICLAKTGALARPLPHVPEVRIYLTSVMFFVGIQFSSSCCCGGICATDLVPIPLAGFEAEPALHSCSP